MGKNKYRLTVYNSTLDRKRYVKIEANKIINALEYADYNIIHHSTEELIKIERIDYRDDYRSR